MSHPYSIVATCLTRQFGIHTVRIKSDDDGTLPDFITVEVADQNDSLKFDPRRDWDAWINTDSDPRAVKIAVRHFVGSVYIQQDLPFMTKAWRLRGGLVNSPIYKHTEVSIGKL